MKFKLYPYLLLLLTLSFYSGDVSAVDIWGTEVFGDANGTKDDPSGEWTTNSSACNFIGGGSFDVQSNEIQGEDLDGIAVWKTQSIDISGYTAVQFSLEVGDNGASVSGDDTVWVYYAVDGGSDVLVYKGIGDLPTDPETLSSINIAGSSLVLSVKMYTNSPGEMYTIDNVLVEDFTAVTYYSKVSGNWNVASNWSTVSHVGADAASFPNANNVNVEIGAGHTMTFNGTYGMSNLTIKNASTMNFSGNNRIVDIYNNGTVDVQAGGSMDRNGTAGSRLRYSSNGFYEVISNGTLFALGRVNTNLEETQITFSGSTSIDLNQHINYNGAGTEIVNSNTGTLTVPLVRFKDPNQKFTNNGTIVTNEFQRQSGTTDGCIITNNSGALMTVNTEMDCFNHTWDIHNYGTFDHNGQWTNVTAGEVNMYNYAGAIYNFSGTVASDPDVYLYADYATNTVNYDLAGNQNVLIPQDAYSNLSLSTSGTKTPVVGAVDVNNDLVIAGTAILDVSVNSNNINLAGNWTNSTATAATFTEGTQTVTLDGTGAQEIENSVDEIFYNLTLNKTTGSVTIEAASDVQVTNQLTITDGTFETGTRSLYGAGNIVATGGDVKFTKTLVTVPEMTGSITCTGGMFTFNGAGAQTIQATPGAEEYHGVLFDGSGTKTLAGTIDVDSILTIDAGVVLDVTATPYNINVEGNWNNLGDFTERTGTVTFDGTAAATISHSSEETFHNLTINNSVASNAITLSSDVGVTNTMTFTTGHVVSTTTNTLKLGTGATVPTVTDGSHVTGPVEKDMNTSSLFEFPIGNGLVYRRAGVTPASTGATTYRMEYFQSKHPVADPSTLDHVSEFEYWTLERLSGTENCDVRLSYDASSVVDDQASLLVVNYGGADWTDECSSCTTGGATSDGWIETGANFAFGTTKYFTMGCNNASLNPLVGQLFSRGTSTWADGTNWSYTDGGGSCSCTPSATTKIVVRNTDVVSIGTPASANSITVLNGGTLRWTSSDDLQIANNGVVSVESGGTFDRNGNTGSLQFMTAGGAYSITNEGTMDIYNLDLFNTGGTVTIAGANDISISDNINVENADISITNNSTGTINLDNTSGDGDFIFKSTGQKLTNNGTISIGRNMTFEDDNSSVVNNSTITITQDISIDGTSDDNNSIANSASATLNIGDDIDLNSSIFTILNSGEVDMDGEFQNVEATEGNFYNYAGSTWRFAGGITSDVDVRLYCNYSTNTFLYDAVGNQNIYVPQDAYSNLIIMTSGTKDSQGNLDVNGDLSILNNAILDVNAGTDDINLAGDWINSSAAGDPFVQGTRTVTMDGSAAQTITNTNGETFNNLVINKSSGDLILSTSSSTDVTIATGGIVTMTKGNIQTTSSEMLTISDDAGMIGSNANSFVSGPLRKLGDDDFTFNVGSGSKWAPVGIEDNSEGETFTVSYSSSGYSDVSVTGVLNNVSTVEYWDVTDGGLVGGNDVDVTLHWKDASASGIDNAADLVVAHFNGTDWEDFGQSAIDFGSVGWIKATGVSSFSPVAPGSKAPGVNTLPVELLTFTAKQEGESNEIAWTTASEINNDHFVVEKSQDGIHFDDINNVPGAGNSNDKINYSMVDKTPFKGGNYYRLKQVDFDGTETYSSKIVFVDCCTNKVGQRKTVEVSAFPNPLQRGQKMFLNIINPHESKEVLVVLMNSAGQELYSKVVLLDEGNGVVCLDINNSISPGIYYVTGTSDERLFQKRIMIK